MSNLYPRSYEFVSADGQNVEIKISGDYSISSDHDWDILTDNDQTFIEEDDGSGVIDWLDEHVKLEDNQRHFVENMIVTVMSYHEMTFDQLLDYQANYEGKQHKEEKEMSEEVNTYGIPMVGLEEASKYIEAIGAGHYYEIFYDKDNGEVWMDHHYDLSRSECTTYRDPAVINIGTVSRHTSPQQIADMIKRWFDEDEYYKKALGW